MTAWLRYGGRAVLRATCILLWAGPAVAQTLEVVESRFVQAWVDRDAGALQDLLAESVRLQFPDDEYLGVTPRQAGARLGAFLADYPGRRPDRLRGGTVEGRADRAFAEFSWVPLAESGSSGTFVLFVGLRRQGDGWRISEIRILR